MKLKDAIKAAKCCTYDTSVLRPMCENCPLEDADDCINDVFGYFADRCEKYRWHDLREDPEDLPEEYSLDEYGPCGFSKEVIVFDGVFYYIAAYEYAIKKWQDDKCITIKTVIAWRYVEPFEVDENERA